MQRPIGVILLAIGAGVAAVYNLYLMLVYMGWISFDLLGQEVTYPDAQWGAALFSLLIAGIWAWVALGFWNVRAYAVQFGIFISLFTLIFGFFSLLWGNSIENSAVSLILAGAIYLYLSYPGVQQHFVENERAQLTQEQLDAIDALEKANANAAAAKAPGMGGENKS